MASSSTFDRELALAEEVQTSVFLVREGLISLERLKNDADLSHLPSLLLSNGFERLLKAVICLNALEENPQDPYFGKIKTHNIKKLLERVIRIAKKWNYAGKSTETRKDMDFLQNCDNLRKLVEVLTDFADKSGRYYNINVVINPEKTWVNPHECFMSYCDERSNNGEINVIHHVTKLLQTFARSLCRMFIWGELGQIGKNMQQIVGQFYYLSDKKLGQVQSLDQ